MVLISQDTARLCTSKAAKLQSTPLQTAICGISGCNMPSIEAWNGTYLRLKWATLHLKSYDFRCKKHSFTQWKAMGYETEGHISRLKRFVKHHGRNKRDVKKCTFSNFTAHIMIFCATYLAFSNDAERNSMHKTWLLCMASFYFASFALQKRKRRS